MRPCKTKYRHFVLKRKKSYGHCQNSARPNEEVEKNPFLFFWFFTVTVLYTWKRYQSVGRKEKRKKKKSSEDYESSSDSSYRSGESENESDGDWDVDDDDAFEDTPVPTWSCRGDIQYSERIIQLSQSHCCKKNCLREKQLQLEKFQFFYDSLDRKSIQ